MTLAAKTLILIDFQTGFESPVWGPRSTPDAEVNALALLEAVRGAGGRIAHVRHRSMEPGSPLSGVGTAFLDGFDPRAGEPVYEKSVNAAFIGTTLEADLRNEGVRDLIERVP